MNNYLLPEDLGNEILNYLASRPYHEVFKVIEKMKSLKLFNESEVHVVEDDNK